MLPMSSLLPQFLVVSSPLVVPLTIIHLLVLLLEKLSLLLVDLLKILVFTILPVMLFNSYYLLSPNLLLPELHLP